jgi:hypothetical protein
MRGARMAAPSDVTTSPRVNHHAVNATDHCGEVMGTDSPIELPISARSRV